MDNKLVDQPEEVQINDDEEVFDLTQEDFSAGEEQVSEPVERELPDKFRNKSLEDVVEMYQNLEKEYGRKGNEVGELRKLTDELLQLEIQQKRNNNANVDSKEKDVVSDDDWFSSPKQATDKYLQQSSLAQEVQQLKEQLSSKDREVAHQAFMEKHPDYNDLIQQQPFADFVNASKYRFELAQKADQFDYEAANELFDLYKALHGDQGDSESEAAKSNRQSQARKKATLEGSGNRNKGTKKVYRRADLIKMKMTDPDRYNAMQDEIMQAYTEGRVK